LLPRSQFLSLSLTTYPESNGRPRFASTSRSQVTLAFALNTRVCHAIQSLQSQLEDIKNKNEATSGNHEPQNNINGWCAKIAELSSRLSQYLPFILTSHTTESVGHGDLTSHKAWLAGIGLPLGRREAVGLRSHRDRPYPEVGVFVVLFRGSLHMGHTQ